MRYNRQNYHIPAINAHKKHTYVGANKLCIYIYIYIYIEIRFSLLRFIRSCLENEQSVIIEHADKVSCFRFYMSGPS